MWDCGPHSEDELSGPVLKEDRPLGAQLASRVDSSVTVVG